MTRNEFKCLRAAISITFAMFVLTMLGIVCCHKEAPKAPEPSPVVVEGNIEVHVAGYVVRCKKLAIHE